MGEHYKFALNPPATLRELARSETSKDYKNTICGVHRMIWMLINVDLNGHIPEGYLENLNDLLDLAYRMGKRMDHRLHQLNRLANREDVPSSEFTKKVTDK